GEVLGRYFLPTPGEPGRDVPGKPIPALPGKPFSTRLDETVVQRDGGDVVAATPGLRVRTERAAPIQQVLTVRDPVGFPSGNIDFHGSVIIHRGIKDRFHVKASQNIQIDGLVEAAQVECGGDLVINAGFAGRDQGAAHVGNHLTARYL